MNLEKARFIGQQALRDEQRVGTRGRSSASRSNGPTSNASTSALASLQPSEPTASRVAVPVYQGGQQVGKATSTTWSPVLKKMIALATIDRPHYTEGTALQSRSR